MDLCLAFQHTGVGNNRPLHMLILVKSESDIFTILKISRGISRENEKKMNYS